METQVESTLMEILLTAMRVCPTQCSSLHALPVTSQQNVNSVRTEIPFDLFFPEVTAPSTTEFGKCLMLNKQIFEWMDGKPQEMLVYIIIIPTYSD